MFHGRPNQPDNLSRYDKGPRAIPVPGTVYTAEAERLGVIPPTVAGVHPGPLPRRPVPAPTTDAHAETPARAHARASNEFARARAAYKRSLSLTRAQFRQEVEESNARISAVEDSYREGVRARKAEADALKAVEKRARAEAHTRTQAQIAIAKRQRQALNARKVELRLARLDERRQAWLDALEKDSATWIGENQIDERITPELFSMKYAWQYTAWFERRDRKKRLEEAARRSLAPGQPLREVVISDDEFASDWESDDEATTGLGARLANENASTDSTGTVGRALAAARLASARAGAAFPEPDYDNDGRRVTPERLAGDALAATGIQLEELFRGKPAAQLAKEYEDWMQTYAENQMRTMKLSEEDQGGFVRDAAGKLVLDDGEREAENAYIDYLVAKGRVEALYYALARKRARLQRDHPHAVAGFTETWGAWLSTIESSGAPTRSPSSGPSGGDISDVDVEEGPTPPPGDAEADGVKNSELVASGATADLAADGPAQQDINRKLDALFAAIGRKPGSSSDAKRAGKPAQSKRRGSGSAASDAESDDAAAASVDGSTAGFSIDPRNLASAAAVENAAKDPKAAEAAASAARAAASAVPEKP